jgi:sterol desaturase/sphingolipid hydroxylase (fatty acid hydroxylase superfamily)|tara:strand:- start:499 stop:1368 length:870 start_codon:yes stop_codon:yes gene_type:complete
MQYFIRLIYLPLFLIVGNGLAIYVVQSGYPTPWLLVILVSFIALSFLFEKLSPYDAVFNQSQGDVKRDAVHVLVNESLNVVGVISVPLIASFIILPSIWPAYLPLWLQVLIAILIADVGITLAHYASHRINTLWRLHAVHHCVKRMYGLNGLMKHPLHQSIETLAGTSPLLLLGAPQQVLMLLAVAVVLQLLLQHSNVSYFSGPLKHILAINAVHRFHHLGTAKEGDVNFGLFTSFTDRMLGTCYFDKDRKITSDEMGIATQPHYPVNYMRQLVEPFRPYRQRKKSLTD